MNTTHITNSHINQLINTLNDENIKPSDLDLASFGELYTLTIQHDIELKLVENLVGFGVIKLEEDQRLIYKDFDLTEAYQDAYFRMFEDEECEWNILICPQQLSILLSVMKIKDLINELNKFNPESTLLFSNNIECFHSMSGCSFLSDYQLLDFTKKEFKEEVEGMEFNSDGIEDEDEYKKEILDEVDTKEVVVFQVSGEENWNQ